MKKLQLSLLAFTLAVVPVAARQLTPAEALSAAGMVSDNTAKGVLRSPSELKLVYTTEKNNLKTSYVFNRNNGNGFVILAADDVVSPVIGYSDKGTFDPNNIPCAMKGYLDNISEEIAWGSVNPSKVKQASETANYQAIAPLCQTKWGQSAPFNLMCPIRTYQGANYQSMTGCVATAMAQIMKVYEYPVKGTGSHSYQYEDRYLGGTYTASSNFAEHTYDWANMIDLYYNSESDAQKNAVAQLMYDCGVSVDMSYSPIASGAVGVYVPNAMATYFGYDISIMTIFRENYKISEWNEIAYKELSQGRPTLITGSNPEGGHAFVCDGYDMNGYFHINWGWDGVSDGYYLLTALDPSSQGAGGTSGGYTGDQGMTIGIKPAVAGSSPVINITCEGSSFAAGADSYSRSNDVYFGNASTQFINWTATGGNVKGAFGVKLVNLSTGEATYISGSEVNMTFLQYKTSYSIPGSKFPNSGDYVVTPAFKPSNGEWIDIRCSISYSSAVNCHIENNMIYFSAIDEGSIEVTDLTAITRAFINRPITYTFNVSCSRDEWIGDIESSLYRKFTNKFYKVASGETQNLSITKGENKTITWETDFSKNATSTTSVKAGTYYLRISEGNGNILAEIEIKIEDDPGELVLDNDAFYAQTNTGDTIFGTRSKPLVIKPTDEVFFKMDVTSGYITDMAQISLYSLSGFTAAKTEKIHISGAKGEAIKVIVPPSIFEGIPVETTVYLRMLTDNNGNFPATLGIRSPVYFQLSEEAGVEDIIADGDANAPVEYFNLQGIPVAKPEPGQLLIRRQGSKTSKIFIK